MTTTPQAHPTTHEWALYRALNDALYVIEYLCDQREDRGTLVTIREQLQRVFYPPQERQQEPAIIGLECMCGRELTTEHLLDGDNAAVCPDCGTYHDLTVDE